MGYQCTTDHFLLKFGLRKQSSPFSYMIIDIQSASKIVDSNFKTFMENVEYVKNINEFMWCNRFWDRNLFFNKTFTKTYHECKNVNEYENVCIWNHHNIQDLSTRNTLIRRCERFNQLYKLKDTLILYIHKIKNNISDVHDIINFCKCLKYNICILFPIYNHEPTINKVFRSENILMLSYKSNYNLNSNDINDDTIDWNSIYQTLIKYYKFNK